MTDPSAAAASAAPAPPAPPAPVPATTRRPLPGTSTRAALIVIAALAVLGVALGALWAWWSPSRPIGFVIAAHAVQPDETESFVAGDGRYLVLTVLAGLGAAGAVWFIRGLRGPLAVLSLAAGGLFGAWLTEIVGHALGGGSSTAAAQTLIRHLPLQLHMRGLLVVEAAIAVLAYGLFVSFAASDDLDVEESDPYGSEPYESEPYESAGSVGLGTEPQHRWGHGDAARALQEPDLAP